MGSLLGRCPQVRHLLSDPGVTLQVLVVPKPSFCIPVMRPGWGLGRSGVKVVWCWTWWCTVGRFGSPGCVVVDGLHLCGSISVGPTLRPIDHREGNVRGDQVPSTGCIQHFTIKQSVEVPAPQVVQKLCWLETSSFRTRHAEAMSRGTHQDDRVISESWQYSLSGAKYGRRRLE